MKDVEAMLAKAGPKPKRQVSSNFTNEVIMKIKTKQELHSLAAGFVQARLWFNHLSRAAAVVVVLGGVVLLGGVGYAAYQWIAPKVDVINLTESNDEAKREYTINSQCGAYFSGQALRYELPKNSSVIDEDVRKVFQNTCTYDAIGSFIDSKWVSDNDAASVDKKKPGDLITIYDHTNNFAGSTGTNPAFGLTIGRVTDLANGRVTITLPIYAVEHAPDEHRVSIGANYDYYPNGKEISRTLPLAKDMEVWEDGKQFTLRDVRPGDMVQLVVRTQHEVKYYEDIHQKSLGAQKTLDVVGMVKTDINTKFVRSLGMNVGDPKITNQIASLTDCHNNAGYWCMRLPNQLLGPIYDATGSATGQNPDDQNTKYLRKDYADGKKVKPYEISGRITAIKGKTVILQTRGKQSTVQVELPYDAIADHNNPSGESAQHVSLLQKVEVGDMVTVHYVQTDSEDHLNIRPGDLAMVALLQYDDFGTIHKY